MKKTIILLILVVVVLAGGFYSWKMLNKKEPSPSPAPAQADYKNASYTIDGEAVKLVNGISEVESAPGSASKTITKYFGNEVRKDLGGDGREDIAFLLTQERGGSGTFFYVVAALNTENGYMGSHAVLLGDRISPQTTESGPGKSIIVNYADRAQGEPMTTPPSFGKSLRLILDIPSMQFGVVAEDFEGEADPARMTLFMNTWKWVRAQYNDGKVITPKKDSFTLTFKNDGSFSATTDCNGIGGNYTATKSTIIFGKMMSTKMYCEGSQEADFQKLLENTGAYLFTSKGELVLNLKFDSGSVYFR